MFLVSLLTLNCAGRAAENDSHPDPIVASFAATLGYPNVNTIEAVKKDLAAQWIGRSRRDVEDWMRQVVHDRGTMGAVQSGGGSYLSLSHWSALLNKDTAFLGIRMSYDADGTVTRLECTYKS